MNETASDCRAIVEYLRDNPTHDVNVVYVELGNEMYYKFSEKMQTQNLLAKSHYLRKISMIQRLHYLPKQKLKEHIITQTGMTVYLPNAWKK